MPQQVTITSISIDGTGKVHFVTGKRERVFSSIAAMKAWAIEMVSKDSMDAITIALVLVSQPTLATPAAFAGKKTTIDLTLPSWGTFL